MKKAKEEISKSDYFLIDYDGPSTGRMIELGIAFALNKKVIVLKQRNIDLKNTVEGVSQFVIEYENLEDIVEKLKIL